MYLKRKKSDILTKECGKKCKYWPPSSSDGKPCSVCDTSDPFLNCYSPKVGRPKKKNTMNQQYRLRLNSTQRDQLKTLAAKHGKTESAMLRELIVKAFERS